MSDVTISQAEYDRLRSAAEEARRLTGPPPVAVPAAEYGALKLVESEVAAAKAQADASRPPGIDAQRWDAWHAQNPGKKPQWADVALMVKASANTSASNGYGLTYRQS